MLSLNFLTNKWEIELKDSELPFDFDISYPPNQRWGKRVEMKGLNKMIGC